MIASSLNKLLEADSEILDEASLMKSLWDMICMVGLITSFWMNLVSTRFFLLI